MATTIIRPLPYPVRAAAATFTRPRGVPDLCTTHGIVIVDPPIEIALEAATRGGGLSLNDHLCVLMAETEGWICVTNDKALRGRCRAANVSVQWGLEIVIELVRVSGIAAETALTVALEIQRANPR